MNKSIWARLTAVSAAAVLAVAISPTPNADASSFQATVKVTPSAPNKVTFTGKVTGTSKTHSAYLQWRYVGGSSWHTLAKVTLSRSGTYTKKVTWDVHGADKYVRLYKPREGRRKHDYSPSTKLDLATRDNTIAYRRLSATDLSSAACRTSLVTQPGKNGASRSVVLNSVPMETKTTTPAVDEVTTVGGFAGPGIDAMSPPVGNAAGGGRVTFTGCDLDKVTHVLFGANPATITSQTAGDLHVTIPAGTGPVKVTLTDAGGTASAGTFTYEIAPDLDSDMNLAGGLGSMLGGNTVSLTGRHLAGTTKVTFTPVVPAEWTTSGDGTMPAVNAAFTVTSDSKVDVVVPPGMSSNPTTVTVTNSAGSDTTSYIYHGTSREPNVAESAFLERANEYRQSGYACDGANLMYGQPLEWNGGYADYAAAHSQDVADRSNLYNESLGADWLHGYPGLIGGEYRLRMRDFDLPLPEVALQVRHTSNVAITPQPVTAAQGIAHLDSIVDSVADCKILMDGRALFIGVGTINGAFDSDNWSEVTTVAISRRFA